MIISPKSDVGFKEIFRNPVVLRHFLADVLGIPAEQIRSVRSQFHRRLDSIF